MSGVEWLYFPLSLLIFELILLKVIEFLRSFFGKLAKLDEELSNNKKKSKSKVTKEKEVETKTIEDKKVEPSSDNKQKEEPTTSNMVAITSMPYVQNNQPKGNYLCDFFDYDSNYVLSREQYICREKECIRKKRYSIMDEMEADNIDSKAYQKISDIINQNKSKHSILDEFNGLSKEMKMLLINSMLNK